MMQDEKQNRALLISGVVIILVTAIGLYFGVQKLDFEFSKGEDKHVVTPPVEKTEEEKNAVAQAGQDYIKTLASYDESQEQPILFKSVNEHKSGAWLADFEVEQIFREESQIYFYTIEVMTDRVVRHNLSVSNRSRGLLISNPEPEQIITDPSFVVKGQVFDGQDAVQVRLIDKNDQVYFNQIAAIAGQENVYILPVELPVSVSGPFTLEVSDESSSVILPFIFTPEELPVL